ncbi:MAG: glycosyltransferase [Bacteroidaceae bacterium]|nr:glycosyltransferase [Bacteroidaceae bacterium]
MTNNPIISIIVPVYNVEKYLPYCLESIQNQTFTNFECILIDDGSTDSSGILCKKISKDDSRFKVIHQENQGYQTARNTGIQNVSGSYISFIDSDDSIHPEMLKILHQTLVDHLECSFSMVYGKKIYQHHKDYKEIDSKLPIKILKQCDLIKNLYGKGENELQYQVVWNKLYKKEILQNLRFLHTGTEDTVFNNSVYLRCDQAIIIEENMYNWFQHSNSVIHRKLNIHFIDRMNSYYIALNDIPSEQTIYKAFCLEKLYKTMINIRYHAKNTSFINIVNKQIFDLKEKTFKDFWSNYHLNIFYKTGLSLFLFVPFFYTSFMKLMEYKTKL